jgi:hypothetical protein
MTMKRIQVLGLLIFVCLLLLAASALAVSGAGGSGAASMSATIRYVATTGNDTGNNCSSSASPCRTVQRAVDQAGATDEIRVATGTYTGVQARDGLTQMVYLDKTLTVRGGYTTANWTVSNPTANPTTLDAQSLGRVMVVTGTITPTLEGLRITGGDCTGQAGAYPWDNDAGGGIYIHTATAAIRNCDIYGNYSSQYGGGLYLHTSPRLPATISTTTAPGVTAAGWRWATARQPCRTTLLRTTRRRIGPAAACTWTSVTPR